MIEHTLLNNERLSVKATPPYDPLQSFVRENHIALEGSGQGPLANLTFAAKDVFAIQGSTYSNGHPKWLETHEPDTFTASAITKLLENGADLVGKTICDELCFSISGENWHYGSPLNPHDLRRYAGGSSSGTGAATAGGLVDFAIGSDCLGSVRVPASYNGVFGMRPTYNRVANDGEAPYCASMDVLGYVANDEDVFLKVSEVLLGEDQAKAKFRRLYIAQDCFDTVDAEVKEALMPLVDQIGRFLEERSDVQVAKNGLEAWVEVFRYVQGYEVWQSYGGWINKYRPFINRGPKERLEWAATITGREYRKAVEKRQGLIAYFQDFLAPDTILVLPTAASIAPLRTASLAEINRTRSQSSNLLCISPLTGTPQVTIPLGVLEGMPLGLSFIGAAGTDLELARFAARVAKHFSW